MGIGVRFHLLVTHRLRQLVLGACLTDEALVGFVGTLVTQHLTLHLRTDRVQRLNAAFVLFEEDMPSVLGAERFADLSGLETESAVFEVFDHHALAEPA